MTKQEYEAKIHEIVINNLKEVKALKQEYILSNRTAKVGDRITSKDGLTIRVDNVLVNLHLLQCIYEGTVVKGGKLTKQTAALYQEDLA